MRTSLITFALSTVALAVASSHAMAQGTSAGLPRRAAAPPPAASTPAPARAAQPRVGTAAAPTPPPAPAPVYAPPVYYVPEGGYIVTGAPYLALSDGSVLVNFGAGYERVLRPCATQQAQPATDPWGRDALGRIPDPPGIAAIKAGTRGQTAGTMPGRNVAACYRVDAQGRPEMVNVTR